MMKVFGKSHNGLRRKNNQDSFSILDNDHALLAIVCDGIGGGRAGDVASKIACEYMQEQFQKQDFKGIDDQKVNEWLHYTIQHANDVIFIRSTENDDYHGMGTTIVGVLIVNDQTYVFNVGDSRAYGYFKNENDDFICLTEDHTYVADLVKSGELDITQASMHPMRHVLMNALGIRDLTKIDIRKIDASYQALLVCSDGLHGYVDESMILKILKMNCATETKVNYLIQASLDAGGYDNVSVIVIEREDS